MRASGLMCERMVSSAGLFSSGMRMLRYMPSSFVILSLCWRRNMKETIKRLEDGVGQKGVQEQLHIKHNDNAGCRPAENFQTKPVGELAHFRLFTRKPHQRPDGEETKMGEFANRL